jgi:hemophore-related protein
MVKHMQARLVVAACALASAWTAGAGVAAADPDLGPFMTTTCTYSQAQAALNALSPDDANQFAAAPMSQTWLHAFLDAPVQQRKQLVQQQPAVLQYTPLITAMANTCKNYPAG